MYTNRLGREVSAERRDRFVKRSVSGVFATSALVFVLPFALVSCGGVEVATFSGVELAFGTALEGESVGPYLELVVALAFAVLASVLAWFGATGPAGGFAVVGAGALALHTFIVSASLRQSGENLLAVRYAAGFWIALATLVAGAVLCAGIEVQRSRSRE